MERELECVMPIEDDIRMEKILREAKTIAVVGASPKPWRDSNSIADFLLRKGYTVIPVNPNYTEVNGVRCYPNLKSIGEPIDIVDIFRNPAYVEEIVDKAIEIGAKTIWMQLGVVNEHVAVRAEQAGLNVIMDRCIAIDYRRLMAIPAKAVGH